MFYKLINMQWVCRSGVLAAIGCLVNRSAGRRACSCIYVAVS